MVSETSNSMSGVVVGGSAVQADTIQNLYLGAAPLGPTDADDPWVRCAAQSRAWRHVRPDRDAEPYRRVALDAVRELARLRDGTVLADDPWQDPGIAVRFAERLGWLLGDESLDLYPAEAALLVVVPFLYRVRSLQLAAARAAVRPTDLQPCAEPDADRAAYEQFIESHDLLVHRARRGAASPLSWWLFHRWLDQHEDLADPDGVRTLLDELPMFAEQLGETFSLKRVCAFLHGLRRGPDVGNRDYLAGLREDDHLRAPGEQHVREPRLALLLALAYGTAIEMTALPEIVAEHLGIPHEVDLGELRRTLDEAVWGGSYDLPVLRAECHHEAVVEGLREYTARADELLHTVRRVLKDHPLPTRLTSDEAAPASGAFTGWARFRLDERRVRSLLMGVELYRDRDLAVRELYQNALDACRYRRARTQFLDRTNPLATYTYEGRIEFRQGVDENGRAYLECQDNGVGMGEAELRGVFSNAGARFAEQLDFKLERAEWRKADPPVELYPNSRFGIGVLSYFMLADEIQVTTCRMDATGRLGPLLDVSIYGPSHLFRIAERSAQGRTPGTTVRMYLRDDIELAESWSVLDVLERLLGIAEFPTTVAHGEREAAWEAGVLGPRVRPEREAFGLDAAGPLVPWQDAPDGAQVVWCGRGGAVLVDGLVVEPEVSRGVLTAKSRGLFGAVVNLSGRFAPRKLSVDRRRVIDDVSGTVAELLAGAAGVLVCSDSGLFEIDWIGRVTDECAQVADLVVMEAVRQGCVRRWNELTFDLRRTGCFPADLDFLVQVGVGGRLGERRDIPDYVLLWRLLAHDWPELRTHFGDLCEEFPAAVDVRVAMPSDLVVLAPFESHGVRLNWRSYLTDALLSRAAAKLGMTVEEAELRARRLGLAGRDECQRAPGSVTWESAAAADRFRTAASASKVIPEELQADPVFRAGISLPWPSYTPFEDVDYPEWVRLSRLSDVAFEADGSIPPGHLARASRALGMPVPEVCAAFARHRIGTDPTGLPDFPSEEDVRFLSCRLDGSGDWLKRSDAVPVGWVLRAAGQGACTVGEVVSRLTDLGFTVDELPGDARAEDAALFERWNSDRIRPENGVPYRHIFDLVEHDAFTFREVVDRYRAYGFECTLSVPDVLAPMDLRLFTNYGAIDWAEITTAQVVPFTSLIQAAPVLGRDPEELARHLKSRGIPVSCEALPAGLAPTYAQELVRVFARTGDSDTSLDALIRAAQQLRTPAWQIHAWLQEWGVDIPDLAETVRAALARVPMAESS
ncbi:ATP-binding protein [Kitasatospora sp. NPDC028055]|uniref:HD domain-containing protein n=1 Tax=Kitasatospora sp. NPDC028055 TaxID=3155653 RepID=UPI0033C098D9